MQLISKGLQIGQAVKNVQRFRQITSIFARHGFEDVLIRMNLGKLLPTRYRIKLSSHADVSVAQRLRECFEELGPTFVKLGQLLSTRPDLIPESFLEEFKKLQDDVAPISYDVVKTVIESEFQKPISELFLEINPTPLASASIAQVHEATLQGGEKVVLKVQRPGIDKIIKNDISLLSFFASLLEKYVPETKIISPSIIVEEFFKTLSQELDFVIEANNIERFSHNMKDQPDIVVPKIYKKTSSSRVLTLEKFEGFSVDDTEELDKRGIDRKKVVVTGAKAFFKSIMIDGLFHGDLHAGNLFVLPGNKLGFIDFGIVGRLSEKARDRLASMLLALMQEDYENLCYQYAELGAVEASLDFEAFEREVRNTVSPYFGLNISEVDSGKILIESTKIATKYNIRIPAEWMIVFRAILTVESMGRSLDPEFDLLSIGDELVKDLVKTQYSAKRFKKEALWIAKDLFTLLEFLPRQIRWMFKKFRKDDFALEVKIPQIEGVKKEISKNGKRLSASVVAAGLIIASVLSLEYFQEQLGELPLTPAVIFVLGVIFLIRVLLI